MPTINFTLSTTSDGKEVHTPNQTIGPKRVFKLLRDGYTEYGSVTTDGVDITYTNIPPGNYQVDVYSTDMNEVPYVAPFLTVLMRVELKHPVPTVGTFAIVADAPPAP